VRRDEGEYCTGMVEGMKWVRGIGDVHCRGVLVGTTPTAGKAVEGQRSVA
jgi:hypothetical protein